MSAPHSARPVQRYGKKGGAPKPSGIGGKILAVIMVVALIAVVGFVARTIQQRGSVPVSASLVTYERQDDETMRLWVDISRDDPSEPSYCIVTALNYAMAEVGRREVILPAGGEEQTRVEVDLPTRDYPVSGGVYGCSTSIPAYMDVEDPTYLAR